MILLVCVDDELGMSFLNRRTSRDACVTERILSLAKNARLFVTPYSSSLLGERDGVTFCNDPASAAEKGDFVFLENIPVPQKDVERIYLFHWGRIYPSDLKFPLKKFRLKLLFAEEFCGSSHDKIRMEEYEVLS